MCIILTQVIGSLPTDLVGSLTGPDPGPLHGRRQVDLAGRLPDSETANAWRPGQNTAHVVDSDGAQRDIHIFARKGAPVVTVNDGRVPRSSATTAGSATSSSCRTATATHTSAGTSAKIAETFPFPREAPGAQGRPRAAGASPGAEGPESRSTKAAMKKRRRAPRRQTWRRPRGERRSAAPRTPEARRRRAPGRRSRSASRREPEAALPEAAPRRSVSRTRPDNGTRDAQHRVGGGAGAGPDQRDPDPRRTAFDPRDYVGPSRSSPRRPANRGAVLGEPRPHGRPLAPDLPLEISPRRPPRARINRSRPSTARSCSSRPRSTAPPSGDPFFGADAEARNDRADHAHERGAAPAPTCLQLTGHQHLGSAARTSHAGQVDRRVLAISSSSPPPASTPSDVTALRPRLSDTTYATYQALDGRGSRHRRRTTASCRPRPRQGLDHRPHDPAPPDPPGHDEAAPDHLADDVPPGTDDASAMGRPRRPHPRRLLPPAEYSQELRGRAARVAEVPRARRVDQS